MSLFGMLLCGCASRALDLVRLHQSSAALKFGDIYWNRSVDSICCLGIFLSVSKNESRLVWVSAAVTEAIQMLPFQLEMFHFILLMNKTVD